MNHIKRRKFYYGVLVLTLLQGIIYWQHTGITYKGSIASTNNLLQSKNNNSYFVNRYTNFNLSVSVLKSVQFKYSSFIITLPNFLSNEHMDIFSKTEHVGEFINQDVQKYGTLDGSINIFNNVSIKKGHDCGYKANPSDMVMPHKGPFKFDILCPILPPNGCTFQHFLDAVLPKLVQGHNFFSQNKNVKLLVDLCDTKFPLVRQLYNMLGFSNDQLVSYNQKFAYNAKKIVNICDTPPLHPYLWQEGRLLLGSQEKFCGQNVIWLVRNRINAYNGGRFILNEDKVIDYLKMRYSQKVILFDSFHFSNIRDIAALFQNASMIIGPHGGAFFNQIFSPKGTVIIEIMPTDYKTGSLPLPHAGVMVWTFAKFLSQNYWRLPSPPIAKNTKVNVSELGEILNLAEKQLCNVQENIAGTKPNISVNLYFD